LQIDLLGYDYLEAGDPSLNEVSSSRERENSIYQMARVGYDYGRKYYLTGTVRRDGFSGFGSNNKIGVFPSVAAGWVITNESFLGDSEWLNFLKLRASYGKSGRRSVSRYSTLARSSLSPSYVFGDGGSPQLGQSVRSLGNNDLGWETTIGSNFAIDFEILKSRITGTMEYYQNKTNDILYSIVIPRITGFNDIATNIAEVSNHGIELSINANIIDNSNFSWNASLNYSRVRNKINSIIGADNDEDGVEDDLTAAGLFIGEPQNVIYDYEVSGMWQLADQENGTIWNGFMPGTYKLTDVNGDGEISLLDDRKILGYQDPSYRVGLANTLRYKNFSLYVFFNSIQGGKNYYLGNDTPHKTTYWGKRDQLSYISVPSGAWDYWMPENPNAKYRRLDNPSSYGGSPYTQRSFIRLQDVSLSYALPKDLLDKLNIKGFSLSLAGKNLATWTKWIGSDPETGVGFEPGLPLLTSISLGMNVQF
jgi:TonB-dependent starch-binding outer membrane protein SusC